MKKQKKAQLKRAWKPKKIKFKKIEAEGVHQQVIYMEECGFLADND